MPNNEILKSEIIDLKQTLDDIRSRIRTKRDELFNKAVKSGEITVDLDLEDIYTEQVDLLNSILDRIPSEAEIEETKLAEYNIVENQSKLNNARSCAICDSFDCYYLSTNKKDFAYCCLHVPVNLITKPISNWICPTDAVRVWNNDFETVPDIQLENTNIQDKCFISSGDQCGVHHRRIVECARLFQTLIEQSQNLFAQYAMRNPNPVPIMMVSGEINNEPKGPTVKGCGHHCDKPESNSVFILNGVSLPLVLDCCICTGDTAICETCRRKPDV